MVAVGSRRPIDRNAGDALTDLPVVRGRMFDWLPRNPRASHPLKDRGGKGGTRGTDRDFGAARFTPQGPLRRRPSGSLRHRRAAALRRPGWMAVSSNGKRICSPPGWTDCTRPRASPSSV